MKTILDYEIQRLKDAKALSTDDDNSNAISNILYECAMAKVHVILENGHVC